MSVLQWVLTVSQLIHEKDVIFKIIFGFHKRTAMTIDDYCKSL